MHRRVNLDELARHPSEEVLVVVPVEAGEEDSALATIASLLDSTPRWGAVLATGAPAELEVLERNAQAVVDRRSALLLDDPAAPTAQDGLIRLFQRGRCDLAVVAAGVLLGPEWLERLRAAARSDPVIASAIPLSLGGAGIEVSIGEPERSAQELLAELAGRVAQRSARLLPRVEHGARRCLYLRRPAVDLTRPLGGGDAVWPLLAELGDQLSAVGLLCVAADDVLVDGRQLDEAQVPADTSDAIAVRETLEDDHRSPLRRAVSVARAAIQTITVTVDARALVATYGGTQTYIRQLVPALAGHDRLSVRVLLPEDAPEEAVTALHAAGEVETVTYSRFLAAPVPSDVVHRPQQVFTVDDLELLRLAGRRLVIGHQDLIAYHNRLYHASIDRWRSFRRTTRTALAVADQIVFFSEHARRDALAEDLVSPARGHVVGIGPPEEPSEEMRRPAGERWEQPFLLCVGADYLHKNRRFAIELLAALRERGWPGQLVLAGVHVEHWSSAERERELQAARPDIAGAVLDLGSVSEPERNWLFRHARALVYPTLYEGFGLLPVEAASWAVPCLFAAQASLAEIAPAAATLECWDAQASADRVAPLLNDGEARRAHLELLRAAPLQTWSDIAASLAEVYERALREPPPAGAPRVWEQQRRESYVTAMEREMDLLRGVAQEYQDAHHELEQRVAIGLRLIDWGGALSPEQQRGMLRLIDEHPRLASLVLAPLRAFGGGR